MSGLSDSYKQRLRSAVRRLAKDKSADYCDGFACLALMGPTTPRDRVVGNAWEAAAREKRRAAVKKGARS